MGSKLAIFIPAYNEERSIGSAVLSAKKYGSVFVVDDGSEDRTAQLAEDAGAKVIAHGKNRGYGAALRTIIETARKTPADVFVIIDGDYQHDPAEIPLVAKPVLEGKADVAVGSRFSGKFVGSPEYRKGGVALLNHLAGAGKGTGKLDFQCGFRAFSKKAAGSMKVSESGYAGGTEMLTSAIGAGLKVVQVPVHVRYYREEAGGALSQGAGLFAYLVEAMALKKPLVFFGATGAALLLCSALLGLFVVDTFYSSRVLPVGSALLTVFTGIGGLVMVLIGINLYTLESLLKRRERDG